MLLSATSGRWNEDQMSCGARASQLVVLGPSSYQPFPCLPPAPPTPYHLVGPCVVTDSTANCELSGHKVIFPTASSPWSLRLSAQRPLWCLPHSRQCRGGSWLGKEGSLGVVRSYVSVGDDPLIIHLQDKTPKSANVVHENIIHKLSRSQILLRKKGPDMRWFFQGFLTFDKFDPTIPFKKKIIFHF